MFASRLRVFERLRVAAGILILRFLVFVGDLFEQDDQLLPTDDDRRRDGAINEVRQEAHFDVVRVGELLDLGYVVPLQFGFHIHLSSPMGASSRTLAKRTASDIDRKLFALGADGLGAKAGKKLRAFVRACLVIEVTLGGVVGAVAVLVGDDHLRIRDRLSVEAVSAGLAAGLNGARGSAPRLTTLLEESFAIVTEQSCATARGSRSAERLAF